MNKQEQEQYSEKVMKRISRNLKRLREKRGWTQYRVAEMTGLAWHTIQKWEFGYNCPKVDKLLWLCRCTGWKLSDVLGGGKTDE